MPTLKQIRQRIRTAKNIQQITRAMKLVAAARLTRAKNRVEEARPYAEKMREFIRNIAASGELPAHPLLQRRGQVERYTVLLMTAERGLAGSFNTNVIRRAWDFLHSTVGESQREGDPARPGGHASVYAVGRKGEQFLGKRGFEIVESLTLPTSGPTIDHAREVAQKVTDMFVSGQTDAIYLVYSKFYSPIRQEPQLVQLLPIEPPAEAPVAIEPSANEKEYKFEPDSKALLELLLPKYLFTLVYQALLESAASEHGARMTAMSNATDNAGKMIYGLTLKANRERQSAITKEILEVVGGAEALKA